jgi:TRAP-type C4-dicarboxylate transport system permease small subunit
MDTLERGLRTLARLLHLAAAFWLFGLAFLILADVIGRGFFNRPLPGTTEIIANSIVSIAFLQLTHAVLIGGMIRTGVLDDRVGPRARLFLAGLGNLAGMCFFLLLAIGVWEPMWRAIEILEYQGEGGLRVPTYPVRVVIFSMSLLASLAYASFFARIVLQGQLPRQPLDGAGHG